jgi:hypothetical protein
MSTEAILEVAIVLCTFLLVSLTFGALKSSVNVPLIGTINETQAIELGLRTDSFWDDYIKSPTTFLNLSNGTVTLIYIDLPWVNELFTNFDPTNLSKPFAKGNWGYDYTFGDYVSFFRTVHQNGIEIVFAIAGIGNSSNPYLNFFSEHPASAVNSEWVNPDYVDPTWGGKTFLQMYAEKINAFASYVGIPAIVSVEDWQYPDYLMQYPQLTELSAALKALNQTNDLWMPPVSFCSARVAPYNGYETDHAWTWEFSSVTDTVGASDVLLQETYDSDGVYHSAMNVVGWLGAQMSAMPYGSGAMLKLYFGGTDLGVNNPGYSLADMKQKLKEIIVAAYLSRVITPEGEYCPVKGFILVYKPPPNATINDMMDILNYAKSMEYLRNVKVLGPILEIPNNLGYTTYADQTSPMGGYMIGQGLIPFRFVSEDNVAYANASEVVTQSGKDYSSNFGISFSATLQCTWLGAFEDGTQLSYVVFHDGGYESGIYNADGAYQAADMTSYKQNTTIDLNGQVLGIPANSVTFFDANGQQTLL